MPAGKVQHPCFQIFYGLPVALILLFSLSAPGHSFAAGSPFEIEIGDLERGSAVSKERKKPRARSAARKKRRSKRIAVPHPKTEERQAGDYTRYTVRPGDHIFKILTTRFGLSSTKAEALIPEVKRINGIVDTSGLQIGQTLLLPLSGKKISAPRETVQAPVPFPAPVSAPVSAPPIAVASPAAAVPPALSPRVDEGLLRRAKDFLARLFPERQPPETVIGKEKAGSVQEPSLTGLNGHEITLVPPGPQSVFGTYSGAEAEKRVKVVADPANEKGFVKELLQAAGFATTDGGAPLEFGTEAKLLLKVDFTAAQRVTGVEKRKTILVSLEKNGCQALPESFVSYLAARDFRLVGWCETTESAPVSSSVTVRFALPGNPEVLVDTVLDALGVQASKDFPIEIKVGQAGSSPLSVSVDRFFEGNGKRFFVDFGTAAPNRATLFRLLELAGYQRIAVAATDDVRTVAAKICSAINIPADYRTHRLTSLPAGLFNLDLAGMLFRIPGTAGEKVFLTAGPVEQPFYDLLKTVPWGTP
ncbi:MAG: LysM domain-containing protein [Deltaproteobacteria bacterium]|nr:LysM domain-containing protein [Deltaproteobacteria bacterium]MRR54657.1 LysM domain-containing protein [Deltaproteobacteria bacterium]TLN02450.1 MAG: LysM peptidoglycan-binding domain-containing protein [bacterium]